MVSAESIAALGILVGPAGHALIGAELKPEKQKASIKLFGIIGVLCSYIFIAVFLVQLYSILCARKHIIRDKTREQAKNSNLNDCDDSKNIYLKNLPENVQKLWKQMEIITYWAAGSMFFLMFVSTIINEGFYKVNSEGFITILGYIGIFSNAGLLLTLIIRYYIIKWPKTKLDREKKDNEEDDDEENEEDSENINSEEEAEEEADQEAVDLELEKLYKLVKPKRAYGIFMAVLYGICGICVAFTEYDNTKVQRVLDAREVGTI